MQVNITNLSCMQSLSLTTIGNSWLEWLGLDNVSSVWHVHASCT